MLIKPTHIGIDIALKIIQELQPDTPIHITQEFLEIINAILNQSLGLGEANLYRIADRILTLIPFKAIFLERIFRNKIQNNLSIYLIQIIDNKNLCFYTPLTTINNILSTPLYKVHYERIIN